MCICVFFGSPHEDVNVYKCPGVCVYMGLNGHVHVSISMSVSVKNDIFTYGALRSGHCSTIHSISFVFFSHSSLMIVALFAIPFVECAITQCNMHVVAYMHHQLASVFAIESELAAAAYSRSTPCQYTHLLTFFPFLALSSHRIIFFNLYYVAHFMPLKLNCLEIVLI